VNSTNDYLKTHRNLGTVVTASLQTHGRGRKEHRWNSEDTNNLYFSGLVELGQIPALPLASLFCGSAVLKTCRNWVDSTQISIKWPNDIYRDQKKIAGLLLEMEVFGNRSQLIIGVGVNFFFEKQPLDLPNAGCLWDKKPSQEEKKAFIFQLIENLNQNLLILSDKELSQKEILWLENHSFLKGKKIQFEFEGSLLMGNFMGYDENGFLLLSVEDKTFSLLDTSPKFGVMENE
jgi:BirA family transcriptional regulator, biotin operon repressor / biotin---[acetyl-CoA-carboxylase] ligase